MTMRREVGTVQPVYMILCLFNFYHGGKLVKNSSGERAWSYLGDLVSWFDYTKSENMSMLELWAMAKDIGYEHGVAFYGEESLHTVIVIYIGDENEQVQNVHEDEQVQNVHEDKEVVRKRDCTQTQDGTKAKGSTYQLSAIRKCTMHKAIEEKERLRT
ncbi:hypothetical protein L3X38_024542 [Prunus dulcis]|uniref:PB1-like domain-containing protein n=1 Tax=Prunus dulcis TaxID=3755 RepID=A0AAD4W003_PRUDU|nr:hypothetical protein L3X38_024542 [Prunus dulcis]